MKTPIYEFSRHYAEKNTLRLHMPGHKGNSMLGVEALDITEIEGADVLYSANGIIRESEENAATLFGSGRTLYSTEGSSLSIRAMLYLAMLYAKEREISPLIVAGRNAHKTFMNSAALLDLEVAWLYGENRSSVISCEITPEGLRRFLDAMPQKPTAVYVTSPDYLGNVLDIAGLASVCHAQDILLLVDNAHGAYLQFLPQSEHPIALGADACCDSAHKTLPVLTGGAYLHLSKKAPEVFSIYAEQAMAMFASTSPSYLILQSLDLANRYLAEGYAERLSDFCHALFAMKARLRNYGFSLVGKEPLKLTVAAKAWGYTGEELAKIFSERNMVCEFYDNDFVTMMLTPEIGSDGLRRVEACLLSIERRRAIADPPPIPHFAESVLSLREAMLCVSEELPPDKCLGRILASAQISCPPAIPIAVGGERIDASAILCMKYYGVHSCRVIKEKTK